MEYTFRIPILGNVSRVLSLQIRRSVPTDLLDLSNRDYAVHAQFGQDLVFKEELGRIFNILPGKFRKSPLLSPVSAGADAVPLRRSSFPAQLFSFSTSIKGTTSSVPPPIPPLHTLHSNRSLARSCNDE